MGNYANYSITQTQLLSFILSATCICFSWSLFGLVCNEHLQKLQLLYLFESYCTLIDQSKIRKLPVKTGCENRD